MTVRPAGLGDVAEIARSERENLGDDAWSEGLVTEGVAGRMPTIRYFVATAAGGDAIVGHAVVSCVAEIAELQRIAVGTSYRRTGIASALLSVVVRAAREAEADRLLLEVRIDNSGAVDFYESKGFVEIDRRRRYYRDGSDAAVMQLRLTSA